MFFCGGPFDGLGPELSKCFWQQVLCNLGTDHAERDTQSQRFAPR